MMWRLFYLKLQNKDEGLAGLGLYGVVIKIWCLEEVSDGFAGCYNSDMRLPLSLIILVEE